MMGHVGLQVGGQVDNPDCITGTMLGAVQTREAGLLENADLVVGDCDALAPTGTCNLIEELEGRPARKETRWGWDVWGMGGEWWGGMGSDWFDVMGWDGMG